MKRALGQSDDLIEALAEIARALIRKSEESPSEAADLQVRAARYADRVVELDQRRAGFVPYIEAQGLVLAHIGDVNLAREAFRTGAEKGSDFSELGLALLDYRQKRVSDARDRLASIANDPARKPETREYARKTLALIDDHASKEQVRDSFDRELLGGLWTTEGALEPKLQDGALVFHGASGRINEESVARRTLSAGDFLRVEVTMRLLGDAATTQFAGVRIGREGTRGDFELFVAMQRQRPEVYIKDGPKRDDDKDEPVPIDALGTVDFSQPQRLAIEVTPLEDGNRESLTVYWNGEPVLQRDSLKTLSQRAAWKMNVDLVAKGKPVDVAFDDFRLVRRKEKK